MTNREAIRRLEEYKAGLESLTIHILPKEVCDLAIKALEPEKEYAIPQGEWIPVSERLPERYKEVIVTDIEVSDTYQSRYIGNGYWECDNGTFKNRIIAWQPLPEPYKEEEK